MKERIGIISLPPSATIKAALQAIDRGGLGLALLVEADTKKFVGLVTDGDIRRALLNGHGLESRIYSVSRPSPKTAHVSMSPANVSAIFSNEVRVIPLLDDDHRVVDLAVFDKRAHLPVAGPSFSEKELLYVSECVLTGWVSSAGKFVSRFEEMFAQFCGTKYAISTCNGTAALHLALLALGVVPGDEVIVPTLTFIATANAVRYAGAVPVFVDSEKDTWNIDPECIKSAITRRTKAIIPVHLYGHPANMESIREIAEEHGLVVIEDAAEAHGARYMGMPVGGIGDIGAFSFYGNKIITTGEGGMITTNRSDLNDKIRCLRDHGMSCDQRYWHPILGYNYRLTNLQAALGVGQMERADALLASKRRIAKTYSDGLKAVPGLTLPSEAPWAKNVYWLYSVLVDDEVFGCSRDDLVSSLKEQHIETRPVFRCLHTQPIYATGQVFPVAERISATGLSLPSAVGMSLQDVSRVIKAIDATRPESVGTTANRAAGI
jgi:perosamine synthetase